MFLQKLRKAGLKFFLLKNLKKDCACGGLALIVYSLVSVLTLIAEEIVPMLEIVHITHIVPVLTLIGKKIVSMFGIDSLLTLCLC